MGTETSGLPGGPLHSHPTRLLLHHQCPFSNSTLERGRDLIWLLVGRRNPGTKDPPYLHNWCFMRGNWLVFNLRLMCFKYPGPYKDQVMSYWWASWWHIGSSWGVSAAELLMDKETETREAVGLRRACSCATAGAKAPGSMTPLHSALRPQAAKLSFLWTGETSSEEKTRKSWNFLPVSFSLRGVILFLHLKFTETMC